MLGKYCSNPLRVLGRLLYLHSLLERAAANPQACALSRLRGCSRALDHGATLLASVSFWAPRRLAAGETPPPQIAGSLPGRPLPAFSPLPRAPGAHTITGRVILKKIKNLTYP